MDICKKSYLHKILDGCHLLPGIVDVVVGVRKVESLENLPDKDGACKLGISGVVR